MFDSTGWYYQVFGPGTELGSADRMISPEGALGLAEAHARKNGVEPEAIMLSRGRNLTDLSYDRTWKAHVKPEKHLWYVTAAVPPRKGTGDRKTRVWRYAVVAATEAEAVEAVRKDRPRDDASYAAVRDDTGKLDMGVYLR